MKMDFKYVMTGAATCRNHENHRFFENSRQVIKTIEEFG